MTDNRIIVRTSKNLFFKSKKYTIKIDGTDIRQLDFKNNKIEYVLPIGKYKLEIGNDNSFKTENVFLSTGEIKIFTIKPNIIRELGLGFFIGLAIVSVFIQLLILNKISIPLMTIPFIPLLLNFLPKQRQNFADSFEIKKSKLL